MSGPEQPRIHDIDDPDQWLDVARDPATDSVALTWIAAISDDLEVLAAVVDNPATPSGSVDVIGRRMTVAADGQAKRTWLSLVTTDRALAAVAASGDFEACLVIAEGDAAGPEALRLLAESESPRIRRGVAWNPRTPRPVLEALACDRHPFVVEAIAQNRSAPQALLRQMAASEMADIRCAVAASPVVDIEVIVALADDVDPSVRHEVALNRRTPDHVLRLLARDEHPRVRVGLAMSLTIPDDCLDVLAEDPDAEVRERLADNLSVPTEIARRLLEDEDLWVRQAAEDRVRDDARGDADDADEGIEP